MQRVCAVINLEAAGTTGHELLFQASSEQMIQAYAHVPRPHGTILANDIFNSGFILSEYAHLYPVKTPTLTMFKYRLSTVFKHHQIRCMCHYYLAL
jgi:hypothetical protein